MANIRYNFVSWYVPLWGTRGLNWPNQGFFFFLGVSVCIVFLCFLFKADFNLFCWILKSTILWSKVGPLINELSLWFYLSITFMRTVLLYSNFFSQQKRSKKNNPPVFIPFSESWQLTFHLVFEYTFAYGCAIRLDSYIPYLCSFSYPRN